MLTLCFFNAEIWCQNACKNLTKELLPGKKQLFMSDWLNSLKHFLQKNSHSLWPHLVLKTIDMATWKCWENNQFILVFIFYYLDYEKPMFKVDLGRIHKNLVFKIRGENWTFPTVFFSISTNLKKKIWIIYLN